MQEVCKTHREQGTSAEDQACEWYLGHTNSQLIGRNYYARSGEIDLIFEDQTPRGIELVFVEVKSRKTNSYLSAIECLSPTKKIRLWRAIQHFLARYEGVARTIRIDLLARDGEAWTHLKSIQLL